jgi:outer membrane protein insertion porin family
VDIKKVIYFLFFIFILSIPSIVYSQEPVISGVEVEGIVSVDSNLVVSMSGLSKGMKLDLVTIQDAMKRIYSMGLFSDVQMKAEETPLGVNLTIWVKEYPKIVGVDILGNKKIKKKNIREKVMIIEGEKVSPDKVKQDVNNIIELYNDKGYFLAQVESQLVPTDRKGEAILKFNIQEGDRVRIKKVDIIGNRVFSDLKLKGKMKNKQGGFLRSGHFNPDKFTLDKEKIEEFYKEKGHLDAEVTSDSIWYSPDKKYMFIRIFLHEGPRYKFGDVSWAGNALFTEEKLQRQVKFKKGEIYKQEKYDQTLADIYALYHEEGYLYARVEDNTATQDSTLNVNYDISEGIPANVRKINIEGNTKTKEKVIRRELAIMPGQRFRRSSLMRSLRNINYLNYFSNVIPDYQVLENGDVDLIIKVEEKPTGSIQFGAGYSQTDKLVGTLGLGIPDLFGNGQNLELNLDFGKRRNTIQASFTEPWFMDTPTSVGLDIYQINKNWYDDFTEERIGGSLGLGRRLRWPDSYFRVAWRYRLENLKYYSFSKSYLESVAGKSYDLSQTNWPLRNSSMSFSIIRDSRDLSQFATRGSVLSWSTELAGGILGGDYDYHKHIFEASKYVKTFWSFVLAMRMKVGVVDGYKSAKVPYSERFSPGGTDPDGVIRGYNDSSIGPRDENGYYLRGKSVLVYNAEYQFPVVEQQIYGLFFFDMGNAWLAGKDIAPFDFKGLYKSAGFGLRLVLPPLGMIGFDMGYGFDKERGGVWRPHFQIGSTF